MREFELSGVQVIGSKIARKRLEGKRLYIVRISGRLELPRVKAPTTRHHFTQYCGRCGNCTVCQLSETVANNIAGVDFDSTSATLLETISRGDALTETVAMLHRALSFNCRCNFHADKIAYN